MPYIGKTFYIEAWHGTNDLQKVLKAGLLPVADDTREPWLEGWNEGISHYEFKATYLTDSPREARRYGDEAIIKVRIPASWVESTEYGGEHGFGFPRSTWYIVKRKIPPNYFVSIIPIEM